MGGWMRVCVRGSSVRYSITRLEEATMEAVLIHTHTHAHTRACALAYYRPELLLVSAGYDASYMDMLVGLRRVDCGAEGAGGGGRG